MEKHEGEHVGHGDWTKSRNMKRSRWGTEISWKGTASVWTSGRTKRPDAHTCSLLPHHFTCPMRAHVPEASARELSQAGLTIATGRGLPAATNHVESRNTAGNLIHTNQMKIHYTRSMQHLQHTKEDR